MIARNSLLSLEAYARERKAFRARVMEHKKVRTLHIGGHVTLQFEDELLIRYQIQEMLRTERITQEAAIAHELETYNALVPGERELSLTLFIEYQDRDERERMLAALAGLEDKFRLRVGSELVPVVPDARGTDRERTMAGVLDTSLFGDGRNPWLFEGYLQYRDESDESRPAHPEAGPSTNLFLFSSTTTFTVFGDLGSKTYSAIHRLVVQRSARRAVIARLP